MILVTLEHVATDEHNVFSVHETEEIGWRTEYKVDDSGALHIGDRLIGYGGVVPRYVWPHGAWRKVEWTDEYSDTI